jgi:hypothetical protein
LQIQKSSEGFTPFYFFLKCRNHCANGGVTNGSIGYLDRTGKIAIKPQFSTANLEKDNGGGAYWWDPGFHANRAMIWEDKAFYYIDTTGRKALALDYDGQFYRAFPFHPAGWTTVVWTDKRPDGTYVHRQDFIGKNGELLRRANSNESHMGIAGNFWEGPVTESERVGFWDGERRQQLWISSDLKDTIVFQREDEEYTYRYMYNPQYVIKVRTCKADKEKSLQMIDVYGSLLTGWSDLDHFTDPVTGVRIVQQNGGCLMSDQRDSLLFSCDSCGFGVLSDIIKYPELSLRGTGVYAFWGKGGKIVNHKGQVLPIEWSELNGFVNLGEPVHRQKEYHTIRYRFTKQELDALYETMPWKYIPPPPPKSQPKQNGRLQFLPPVVTD